MGVHFDVRTKTVLLLVTGICTFIVNTLSFEAAMVLLISALQLVSNRETLNIRFLLLYFVLAAIQLVLFPILPDTATMILSVPIVNFRKMFPSIMAVLFLIKTTRVNEAIATMTKMRMPKAVTVTFAVALRYIPVLGEEWRHIHDAMKIRQLDFRNLGLFRGIAKRAECCLVPILISTTKTAEDLSAAAITRGIENPSPGTCRGYKKMACQDYVLLTLCTALIPLSVFIRGRR